MRKVLCALIALSFAVPVSAGGTHSVRGYTRSDGTYVAPHMQTNPDSPRTNNWSYEGNVNPYNGRVGTANPYPLYNPPRTPSYTPYQPRSYTPPCYYNCSKSSSDDDN
jgi:hypothetical protein